MGTNDLNKTPEVSTSVESKNSIVTSVKLALAGLLLYINTNNAIAQNTTPDTNKVLAQTEITTTDPTSIENILAKHNITDIANCTDKISLSKTLQEIKAIVEKIPDEEEEKAEPYLITYSEIKKRLEKLGIDEAQAKLIALEEENKKIEKVLGGYTTKKE